jgi:hypothetical protein
MEERGMSDEKTANAMSLRPPVYRSKLRRT